MNSTRFQKYVCRPADRLAGNHPRLAGTLATLGVLAGFANALLNGNTTDPTAVLIAVLLFFAPIVASICLFIFAGIYNHEHDQTRDTKIAQKLLTILTQTGPLPLTVLEQHYNARNRRPLPKDAAYTAITNRHTSHLFIFDDRQPARTVATNTQAHRITEIPTPINGDYMTGYHQLYRRLAAIREHPELITVQDSLIDDLYGIC